MKLTVVTHRGQVRYFSRGMFAIGLCLIMTRQCLRLDNANRCILMGRRTGNYNKIHYALEVDDCCV